jgi:hypothetical protein
MCTELSPDKTLVSVCGLYCRACGIYTSTRENNVENLQRIATRMNVAMGEIRCNGCRSETRTAYCKDCFMVKCATAKGIDFCGQCADYPCTEIKDFQSKMPHRAELWKSQERIKEIGWEKWFTEMADYYACRECGAMNGWYDFKCRECGNIPGNDFVKNNLEVLKTVLKNP